MKNKINRIYLLSLIAIAGCSSEAALNSSGSSVPPANQVSSAVLPKPVMPAAALVTPPPVTLPPAQVLPVPVAPPVLPIVSSPASVLPPSSSEQNGLAQSGYGFDQWQKGAVGDVFFEFDSSVLSAKAQELLAKNASWFGRNPSTNARIEGHCDSRGTSEYNIALGERRATSAKEYLVRLGVASSRLEFVSFGEERPFDLGQSNEAMANNRRAHFIVK